ncbi:MAG: 2-oxo-4-hydroxy-4-carboxy-5-ureidoimidazoline decarboxylase [Gammaproteobacteria bacterium]|jgi:2-oxo-4-hydroxy-4-carboxy-5-ureidoimidazoline decarboxylase
MNQLQQYRISDINAMNSETFISVFGAVFEDASWVASKTWEKLPFETTESFIDTMCATVSNADHETKLALLCAHPELGSNKKMAEASEKEQSGAGIREGADANKDSLEKLNARYREKFGFPFIIAVKGLSLEMIIDKLQSRLSRDKDTEFHECLQQVFRIARFRLGDLLVKE